MHDMTFISGIEWLSGYVILIRMGIILISNYEKIIYLWSEANFLWGSSKKNKNWWVNFEQIPGFVSNQFHLFNGLIHPKLLTG